MGWTNRSVANSILFVNHQQKRELGNRVARLMDEQGLTNEKLAFHAGLSSKTISRVVNAKHELRVGTIEKLAAGLKVSEAELRGPPPAPLGLGVEVPQHDSDVLARLDSIDEKLKLLTGIIEQLAVATGVSLQAEEQAEKQARQPASSRGRRQAS